MKFAYCILAHNQPELLQKLLDVLDDPRNDIFLHIDAKTDIKLFKSLITINSNLYFVKNRIDVRWGDISQIMAEYSIFRAASSNGKKYDYYHLLSGVDLPLKTQDEIHDFISSKYGCEFIEFWNSREGEKLITHRTSKYHLFNGHKNDKSRIGRLFFRYLRKSLLGIQYSIGFKRKFPYSKIGIGSNWISITDNFLRYALSQEEVVIQAFRFSSCADELFMQTLALNSDFKDNIYSGGNLREINFAKGEIKGSPYTWRQSDYDTLTKSTKLFARKFNINIDPKIVELICNKYKPMYQH